MNTRETQSDDSAARAQNAPAGQRAEREHLRVLRNRLDYVAARVANTVQDHEHRGSDRREIAALQWAIYRLTPHPLPEKAELLQRHFERVQANATKEKTRSAGGQQ